MLLSKTFTKEYSKICLVQIGEIHKREKIQECILDVHLANRYNLYNTKDDIKRISCSQT